MENFKESDMYLCVKKLFVDAGYSVKSEILDCDLVAALGEQVVIVEMKKSFSLEVLYQAIDRTKFTSEVYVCVPDKYKKDRRKLSNMKKLVRKLKLGLIFVSVKRKTAEIIVEPEKKDKANKAKKRLMKEFGGRSFDGGLGGITGKKIITAYKEQSVKIACALLKNGQMSAKELRKNFACPENTYNILYDNFYNWFVKIDRGIYDVTDKCKSDLKEDSLLPLSNYYGSDVLL